LYQGFSISYLLLFVQVLEHVSRHQRTTSLRVLFCASFTYGTSLCDAHLRAGQADLSDYG